MALEKLTEPRFFVLLALLIMVSAFTITKPLLAAAPGLFIAILAYAVWGADVRAYRRINAGLLSFDYYACYDDSTCWMYYKRKGRTYVVKFLTCQAPRYDTLHGEDFLRTSKESVLSNTYYLWHDGGIYVGLVEIYDDEIFKRLYKDVGDLSRARITVSEPPQPIGLPKPPLSRIPPWRKAVPYALGALSLILLPQPVASVLGGLLLGVALVYRAHYNRDAVVQVRMRRAGRLLYRANGRWIVYGYAVEFPHAFASVGEIEHVSKSLHDAVLTHILRKIPITVVTRADTVHVDHIISNAYRDVAQKASYAERRGALGAYVERQRQYVALEERRRVDTPVGAITVFWGAYRSREEAERVVDELKSAAEIAEIELRDDLYGISALLDVEEWKGLGINFASTIIPTPYARAPARAGIVIGYDERNAPVVITPSLGARWERGEVAPHMVVCGITGAGKSTMMRYLLLKLYLYARRHGVKLRYILVDPHGEYVPLLEILRRLYGDRYLVLNERADPLTLFLNNTVLDRYSAVAEVLDVMAQFDPAISSRVRSLRDLAVRRLDEVGYVTLRDVAEFSFDVRASLDVWARAVEPVGRLPRDSHVVFTIPPSFRSALRNMMYSIAVHWAYHYDRNVADYIDKYVVLEEAFSFAKAIRDILPKLYVELRKFGYAVITVTQLPEILEPGVTSQAISLILAADSPEYVGSVMAYFKLPPDVKKWITTTSYAESRGLLLLPARGVLPWRCHVPRLLHTECITNPNCVAQELRRIDVEDLLER